MVTKIAVAITKMTDDYEDHCVDYEDHCGDYEDDWWLQRWLMTTKIAVVITKMTWLLSSLVITKMTGDYEVHCGDYEDDCEGHGDNEDDWWLRR